jgi:hypothetical protein
MFLLTATQSARLELTCA